MRRRVAAIAAVAWPGPSPCGSPFISTIWVRNASRRVPPPLPSRSAKLPPPPPLPGAVAANAATAIPWRSPQEVLTAFVDFIPTFYVPTHCVAAILSEDCRRHFIGRGRFLSFLKRYSFFFDLRVIDGIRSDVKLRDDLSHPRRGAADEKFVVTDVGDYTNYVARPEFIVSMESLEQGNQSVPLKPASAPPAVHVRLEERVPVLERLKALVPAEFELIDHVEEGIPEDILFHPYFDCQGGLAAIASKFPEFFQVVEKMIRRRPPHLAPLALNDYTLDDSPIPSVAQLLREQVCASDIPHWVSVTSLYEQLTREQKRQVKREFKSFASFLRSHGKSLSLSQDMLQIARWIPQCQHSPKPGVGITASTNPEDGTTKETNSPLETAAAAAASGEKRVERGAKKTLSDGTEATNVVNQVMCNSSTNKGSASGVVGGAETKKSPVAMRVVYEYTHTQVINELFDKFPPHRTLNLEEVLALLSPEMQLSVPKKVLAWLASYPTYFVVDDSSEKDPKRVRVRRASDRQPLDVALVLYQHTPEDGIPEAELLQRLPEVHSEYVRHIGLRHIVNALPEWLALSDTMVLTRLQTEVDLDQAIHSEESKRAPREDENGNGESAMLNKEADSSMGKRWPKLRYEGGMSSALRPTRQRGRGSGSSHSSSH